MYSFIGVAGAADVEGENTVCSGGSLVLLTAAVDMRLYKNAVNRVIGRCLDGETTTLREMQIVGVNPQG